jgi:hypothetical protein
MLKDQLVRSQSLSHGNVMGLYMQPGQMLVFVYNLDRSNLSVMTDYHKSTTAAKISPCNLYALIFSPVGMKKGWKRFINDLGIPSRYLYRDEFGRETGISKPPFPAIYKQSGKSFEEIISAIEINRMESTDSLIALVTQRLTHFRK